MFSFKNLKNYKKSPICVDISSNNYLYLKDIINFKIKINKIVKNKCLVFLIYSNNIDFVAIYLSILSLKIVPLILNERTHKSFLNKLKRAYKPRLIFFPNSINIKKKTKKFSNYYSYETFNKNSFKIDKNIALLASTSGTTGSSKNVVCSYKNLNFSAYTISKYLKISKNDRPLMTLPLSYVYGLSVLNSHIIKRATIYLASENFLNRKFWEIIVENKITTFPLVPYQVEMLNKINFGKFDLNYIKYLTVAGGKTTVQLLKNIYKICKDKKIKLFCMYGQAEATSRISYLDPKYLPQKIGSIGKPIIGGKLTIINKNGKMISAKNVKGELVYKGKNVMLGYSNSYKDLSNFLKQVKYLFTGDIAYKDNDNFFYITGRKSRDIKIFSNRINLDEIEDILKNKKFDCRCVSKNNLLKIFVLDKKQIDKIYEILPPLININKSYLKAIYIKKFPLGLNKKVDYTALEKL